MTKCKLIIIVIFLFSLTSIKAQIYTGGGFSAGVNDGYVIDFSPLVGYKYRIFEAGMAPFINYAEKYQKYTFGGRIFADVSIYQDVFARAEFEVANIDILEGGIRKRQWVLAMPLGAGYKQNISKGVNAYFAILYNVLHNAKSHTKNPIIRAGITYDL